MLLDGRLISTVPLCLSLALALLLSACAGAPPQQSASPTESAPEPSEQPSSARRVDQDLVLIECVISEEGIPTDCRIVKGSEKHEHAATILALVKKQRYKPVIYQGRPRAATITFPIRVKLR